MQALPPEPKNDTCSCCYDADTGYFSPCSELHEQEYIEFLLDHADNRELAEEKLFGKAC